MALSYSNGYKVLLPLHWTEWKAATEMALKKKIKGVLVEASGKSSCALYCLYFQLHGGRSKQLLGHLTAYICVHLHPCKQECIYLQYKWSPLRRLHQEISQGVRRWLSVCVVELLITPITMQSTRTTTYFSATNNVLRFSRKWKQLFKASERICHPLLHVPCPLLRLAVGRCVYTICKEEVTPGYQH